MRVVEGESVTLKVGDEEHAARVDVIVAEGHVVLRLVRTPDKPLELGADAVVYAVDATGLHRLSGRLDPSLIEPDVVALRWEAAETIQRRQFVRVEATCDVEVLRSGKETISTSTVNVSGSGFLLAGPDNLDEGAEVQLAVKLDDKQPPLRVTAEVVRVTGNGNLGVHILEIDEGDRERLVDFCIDRQRSAPRVRMQ
jgi:hypothetical protein